MVNAISTKNRTLSHKSTSSVLGRMVLPRLMMALMGGKMVGYAAPKINAPVKKPSMPGIK